MIDDSAAGQGKIKGTGIDIIDQFFVIVSYFTCHKVVEICASVFL